MNTYIVWEYKSQLTESRTSLHHVRDMLIDSQEREADKNNQLELQQIEFDEAIQRCSATTQQALQQVACYVEKLSDTVVQKCCPLHHYTPTPRNPR